MDYEIIDTATGKIVATSKSSDIQLEENQVLMDPTCQEYDSQRQLVRSKSPPLSAQQLLFSRVKALEAQTVSMAERLAILEAAWLQK